MLKLKGIPLPQLPVDGLEWVRDLEYFEGPLVSHYIHPRGDHYIHYWVDCDSGIDRWMWIRVSENHVIRLANRLTPLDEVLPVYSLDDYVYFVDSKGSARSHIILTKIRDIPDEYKPSGGVLLRPESSNESTFPILINSDLEPQALGDIPRVFIQAYSMLFMLSQRHKTHRTAFLTHPWKGGFSAVHFYNEVGSFVPTEGQVSVEKIQYASPGFIRFGLDRPTAEFVSHCVGLVSKKKSDATRAYHDLGSYIWKHKLNELKPTSIKWTSYNDELTRKAKRLLDALDIHDPMVLINAAPRPFEAAKIARSIYSRLSKLARYQNEGLITIPKE